VNPPRLATAIWTERYESLRQHAVAGSSVLSAHPLGLILLSRQGVAGWMRGWRELVDPLVTASASPLTLPAANPVSWQNDLTVLLAQMTAQHLHPE
jgi:hypothetical protein